MSRVQGRSACSALVSAQEGLDLGQELGPGRLVRPQEVVAAGEGHEPGARDQRRQPARLLEWDAQLVAGVQHQGGRRALVSRLVRDIDVSPRLAAAVPRSRPTWSAGAARRTTPTARGGASGMKLEVKNRRNDGSSRPHPRRTISNCSAASRRCSSVVARRMRPCA